MSTMGLMGVRVNGVDKLSFAKHDSYPQGWPRNMVRQTHYILDQMGRDRFITMAKKLKMVRPHKVLNRAEMDVMKYRSKRFGISLNLEGPVNSWYEVLHPTQGKLFDTLFIGVSTQDKDFIADSLLCEWAYIANLDDNVFEVYRGDQKRPHEKGRYCNMTQKHSAFYPCALVRTFPLDNIPRSWKVDVNDVLYTSE